MSYTPTAWNKYERELLASLGEYKGDVKQTTNQLAKYIIDQLTRAKTPDARLAAIQRLQIMLAPKLTALGHTRNAEQLFAKIRETISMQTKLFEGLGYDLTDVPLAISDAALGSTMNELGGMSRLVTSEITQELQRAAITGTSVGKLTRIIESKIDKMQSHSYAIANTGMAGIDRDVTTQLAEALDIEFFTYFGSQDKRNRQFCKDLLNNIHPNTKRPHSEFWHVSEIRTLVNGQKLEVLKYGGGYNCRHRWLPVSNRKNQELMELRGIVA